VSWVGLQADYEAAAAEAKADAAKPLKLCPLCGNILTVGTYERVCDVGHFRAPLGATAGSY